MNLPLRTKKPTTFFVNSMSDLFGEGVDDDMIKRVFATMNATMHQYQVLTKRPNRALKMADKLDWTPNIWMGTSIEEDKFVGRADLLRKIPAAVRFLSAEPLLSALPLLDLRGIDWVIVGGESGPGSRPISADWARDLRDRCVELGVAFFFKQWGNFGPDGVRRRGKKGAGRELDGQMWEQMPTQRPEGWQSLAEFRADLHVDRMHDFYAQVQVADGVPARIALRDAILAVLADGPLQPPHLRARACAKLNLNAENSTITNLNAWALVDLQRADLIQKIKTPSRGMTRASKPIFVTTYSLTNSGE
jgi:protein gp37